jgi:Holliday junction resolvasome RuvABC DNA-binding subunit
MNDEKSYIHMFDAHIRISIVTHTHTYTHTHTHTHVAESEKHLFEFSVTQDRLSPS